MALGKVFKVVVGTTEDAVDFSNLVIGFRIKRSNVLNDNTAEINIANVSDATYSKMQSLKSAAITVEAGYEDEDAGKPSQIFVGNVLKMWVTWDGADRLLNIKATVQRAKAYTTKENKGQSIDFVYRKEKKRVVTQTYIKAGYAPGSSMADAIQGVASGLGLTLIGGELISTLRLSNGWNHTGTVQSALSKFRGWLLPYGYDLTVDITQIVIYDRDGGIVEESVAYLSATTGLLGVGKPMDYQVNKDQVEAFPPKQLWELTTILMPSIGPSSIVEIDDPKLTGSYLVENIEHYGDNAGGDYNSKIIVGVR